MPKTKDLLFLYCQREAQRLEMKDYHSLTKKECLSSYPQIILPSQEKKFVEVQTQRKLLKNNSSFAKITKQVNQKQLQFKLNMPEINKAAENFQNLSPRLNKQNTQSFHQRQNIFSLTNSSTHNCSRIIPNKSLNDVRQLKVEGLVRLQTEFNLRISSSDDEI